MPITSGNVYIYWWSRTMRGNQDDPDDNYSPGAVMARVGHLSVRAQRETEQITRIIRSTFGHGGGAIADEARIVRIVLTAPLSAAEEADGYGFAIEVNSPECADEAHWDFTRKVIAAELGTERAVMVRAAMTGPECERLVGPVLYDAATDTPLNARELPRNPGRKGLH